MIYSDVAISKFYLNSYFSKSDLIYQVNLTQYLKGLTNTAGGIREMSNVQFTAAHGDRPDAKNIGIIILFFNKCLSLYEMFGVKSVI